MAGFDHGAPEGDREVRFADTGGANISMFSARARKRAVASSRTSRWSTDGWN
jgi:hypothetical protein